MAFALWKPRALSFKDLGLGGPGVLGVTAVSSAGEGEKLQG